MAFVVVSLTSEYLPDGSFHVYSPQIPGFHVVEPAGSKMSQENLFKQKIRPLLEETMRSRVAEADVGREVHFWDTTAAVAIPQFIPAEIRRRLGPERRANGIPTQLIAEIK